MRIWSMWADEFGIVLSDRTDGLATLVVLDFLPLDWIERCRRIAPEKYESVFIFKKQQSLLEANNLIIFIITCFEQIGDTLGGRSSAFFPLSLLNNCEQLLMRVIDTIQINVNSGLISS